MVKNNKEDFGKTISVLRFLYLGLSTRSAFIPSLNLHTLT